MEVSALRYSGAIGLHGRSALLRLQADDRLISLVRRGNNAAFETLVSRYDTRLLAFCRHLLGSREDAEDVLQEVFAAAYNAILADDRPINVRPWLYRIARNRSLNHLRKAQAVGVDSMDVHLSENGATTADKVHDREEFRLLVGDIQGLPETQRTALLLREMDALSYEQIAEAMETTVPSVKSLLVRARVSLAEAAEARLLSCDQVRTELGEVAEGIRRRSSPPVRRHLRDCRRCAAFRVQLRATNKALTALLPVGPFVVLRKLLVNHAGHSASSSGAGASGSATAVGSAGAGTAAVTTSAGGFISATVSAIATKAVAGLAAAVLLTAGAVEVTHVTQGHSSKVMASLERTIAAALPVASTRQRDLVHARTTASVAKSDSKAIQLATTTTKPTSPKPPVKATATKDQETASHTTTTSSTSTTSTSTSTSSTSTSSSSSSSSTTTTSQPSPAPGRTQEQTDPTVLPPTASDSSASSNSGQPTTPTDGSSSQVSYKPSP